MASSLNPQPEKKTSIDLAICVALTKWLLHELYPENNLCRPMPFVRYGYLIMAPDHVLNSGTREERSIAIRALLLLHGYQRHERHTRKHVLSGYPDKKITTFQR
ncbi:uncharacterized protein H6S33_011750 [Morchella sextelata]|uniref:uncharacterized protein n=1 Tax=Morchella sextelata TaxID=1174677 RepID=UPI001D03DA35|nr:uncharacterized protein H6S33_011750 [Morchella sextelata]KAH0610223.1 hypothetical protein H6S33_011750 [Morchella sextelata]